MRPNAFFFCSLLLPSMLMGALALAAAKRPNTPVVAVAPDGHYDELFEHLPDGSIVLRPQYRDIVPPAAQLTQAEVEQFDRDTKKDFRDDNALTPLPRVLTEAEANKIDAGVKQRGRALLLFLQDFHATGGFPVVVTDSKRALLTKAQLDEIVARNLETQFVGKVNPKTISVLYGPDLLRDRNGDFRPVEDNTGFLGGQGDLVLALKSLNKHLPAYKNVAEIDPMDFYRNIVARYKARANPKGKKLVFLQTPPYADNEDSRIMQIYRSLGVAVITPNTAEKVEFDKEGAWYRARAGARRERIGFLALNGEHWFMDSRSKWMESAVVRQYAAAVRDSIEDAIKRLQKYDKENPGGNAGLSRLEREARFAERLKNSMGVSGVGAKEFLDAARRLFAGLSAPSDANGEFNTAAIKQALQEMNQWSEFAKWQSNAYDGLVDTIMQGKVATNYSLGTNFINDKAFYPYVEGLIRTYLGEEPILKNIETHDVPTVVDREGKVRGDRTWLEGIAQRQKEFVIKVVDGRGGKGVYVGPKISKKEFAEGLEAAYLEPNRYKVQSYLTSSIAGRNSVDIRAHADIAPNGDIYVSPVKWGRAVNFASGDGKVNLSARGSETAVITRSSGRICELLFMPVAR